MADQPTLLDRVASLNVWRRGDERAPHKPLLLLYALARVQRGEPRLIPFADIERDLRHLLERFGPPRHTRPEYPFWHMQSDGLWDIPQRAELQADVDDAEWRHNPRLSLIRRVAAQGGLPPEDYHLLRANPELVIEVATTLLDRCYPPSLHEDVLDAVGMHWAMVRARPARDPSFRPTILRIYSHRCAVCGYDGQLEHSDLCLEAAHVKWHNCGGPDSEDNGLALCNFHHKAFDSGALGIDDDHRILVSQHVRGSSLIDDLLVRFSGQPLNLPLPGEPPPATGYVKWHRREVFREPARRGQP